VIIPPIETNRDYRAEAQLSAKRSTSTIATRFRHFSGASIHRFAESTSSTSRPIVAIAINLADSHCALARRIAIVPPAGSRLERNLPRMQPRSVDHGCVRRSIRASGMPRIVATLE